MHWTSCRYQSLEIDITAVMRGMPQRCPSLCPTTVLLSLSRVPRVPEKAHSMHACTHACMHETRALVTPVFEHLLSVAELTTKQQPTRGQPAEAMTLCTANASLMHTPRPTHHRPIGPVVAIIRRCQFPVRTWLVNCQAAGGCRAPAQISSLKQCFSRFFQEMSFKEP